MRDWKAYSNLANQYILKKCSDFIVNIISCGLLISDFLIGGFPFNRLLKITTYFVNLW